jgi:putative aldouronate transport system substrate-binding protein
VRIIKFLDAQITEEWQKLFFWGVQGEDYQLDAKGVPYRTPEQRRQQEDPAWILRNKANLWTASSPKIEGTYSDGNAVVITDIPGEYQASLHPEDREVLKAYGVSSYAELMDPNPPPNPPYYPAWQLSPPDSTDGGIAARKVETAYMRNLPKVIFGKAGDFEKNWKTYLDDLNKANLGAYEKYIQDGINQRLKTWGR